MLSGQSFECGLARYMYTDLAKQEYYCSVQVCGWTGVRLLVAKAVR